MRSKQENDCQLSTKHTGPTKLFHLQMRNYLLKLFIQSAVYMGYFASPKSYTSDDNHSNNHSNLPAYLPEQTWHSSYYQWTAKPCKRWKPVKLSSPSGLARCHVMMSCHLSSVKPTKTRWLQSNQAAFPEMEKTKFLQSISKNYLFFDRQRLPERQWDATDNGYTVRI